MRATWVELVAMAAILGILWGLAYASQAHGQLPNVLLVPYGEARTVRFEPRDAGGLPTVVDADPHAQAVYRIRVEIDDGCPQLWPIVPTFYGPRHDLHVSLLGMEPGCSGRVVVSADGDLTPAIEVVRGSVDFLVVPPELIGNPVELVPVEVGTAALPLLMWLGDWSLDIQANGAPAYD